LYSREYFFGEEYKDYVQDESIIKKNFEARLKVLNRYIHRSIHKSVLEIGCAYGFFLDLVRERFDEVLGVDISADGVNYARNQLDLNVLEKDFLDVNLKRQTYVACMWDTIEHLRRPDLYIEHFSKHAEPGSLLAISTGDIGSVVARIRKDRWRMIHPPTHLHYFSMSTIKTLLQKYDFEVIYSAHPGVFRTVELVLYRILVLHLKRKNIFNKIPPGVRRLSFYSNFYDILFVIGKKK